MKYNGNFILFCQKLGSKIKSIREQQKISIKEMAVMTDIRIEYLIKIEQGTAYGVLLDKHLSKIAKALHLKLYELFDFEKY